MMKKRKNALRRKIVKDILLWGLFFLFFILILSADWFLVRFEGVEISTVVYQLFSPLKGTDAGIVAMYANNCLYPAIMMSLLLAAAYAVYDLMSGRMYLQADIRIGRRNYVLKISGGGHSRKFAAVRKRLLLAGVIAVLCVCVWDRAKAVGIPEYVSNLYHSSTVFETEYVDPDDVALTFPEKKRNLIVLYMESMETTYASREDGGSESVNYIPGLTRLAKDNVFFSNDEDLGGAYMITGTGWTMGALFSSATGVPYKLPIGMNEGGHYAYFAPGLKGIGEVLQENGYHNYFLCGSNSSFGGRASFYEQHGDYTIYDYNSARESGFVSQDYHEGWGIEDAKMYQYAQQELTKIAQSGEPFNFMMLTVDTHFGGGHICDICDNMYPEQYANVLACADRQAVQFIDWLSRQEWYENTTVVITGDHLTMEEPFMENIDNSERRIYNCFINLPDGLSAYQTTDRDFTTLDLFPTMLAAVGVEIEGDRLGLGTNLFAQQQTLYEQMGEELEEELKLYSNYYYKNFIVDKD